MKSAKASGYKEAKSGGRVAQTVTGSAKGSPSAKFGGGKRGEFATASAGTPAGSLGSRGEFAQHSANKK